MVAAGSGPGLLRVWLERGPVGAEAFLVLPLHPRQPSYDCGRGRVKELGTVSLHGAPPPPASALPAAPQSASPQTSSAAPQSLLSQLCSQGLSPGPCSWCSRAPPLAPASPPRPRPPRSLTPDLSQCPSPVGLASPSAPHLLLRPFYTPASLYFLACIPTPPILGLTRQSLPAPPS